MKFKVLWSPFSVCALTSEIINEKDTETLEVVGDVEEDDL
jgi:hypothetical protein